jgi:hypothetical protein
MKDEIPDRISQTDLSYAVSYGPSVALQTGYHYYFADEDRFNGVPHLRETLHRFGALAHVSLAGSRFHLSAGGAGVFAPARRPDGTYEVSLTYNQPIGRATDGPPYAINISSDFRRERELSVATAVDQQISYRQFSVGIDIDCRKVLSIAGMLVRQYYSDDNQKTISYLYTLFHVVADPAVSLGYAYSYSTSLFDNWRLTDTRRVSFDPLTRNATYEYSYFYYPYFTPIREYGHMLIALFQGQIIDHLVIYGKATVPFFSKGLSKYFPSSGPMPAPFDYDAYFDVRGVQPSQYEVRISTDLADPVTVQIRFEYFNKPYYTYHSLGVDCVYHFD